MSPSVFQQGQSRVKNLPEHSGAGQAGRLLGRLVVALCLLIWLGSASATEMPRFDCVITPYAMAEVSSAVPGTLQAVHLDRGDRVEKGQVVADLDSGVERASLALARMRSTMEHEIQLGRINLAFDERERERLDSLYQKKVASFHDKDRAERDANLSQWKLRQARDVNELRKLELRKAEEVLKQKTVRSPIKGVVVERYRSAGEYVEDQPIMRIAQLDPLNVEAIVPMQFFGKIQVGMAGEVVPETVLAEPHRATVTVVDWMGNAASGTFGVRLELANPDYRLPAGQKCAVRFLLDSAPAPRAADATLMQPAADASHARVSDYPSPADAWPEASDVQDAESAADSFEDATADVALGRIDTYPTNQGDLPAELPMDPLDEPSESVASTAPVTPRSCHTVGPLEDTEQLEQLSLVLYDSGFRVSRREETRPSLAGYIVLTPPQDVRDDVRQLATRLKEQGIQDLQLLRRGRQNWRLSLGVYTNGQLAISRRDRLASLGVETEIQERTEPTIQWWLDLVPVSPELSETTVRDTLYAIADGLQIIPVDCPSILTAQR